MRKLVSYFIENSTQLLFFLLLGFSALTTIQHHAYYRSQVVGSVNSINGGIAQQIFDVEKHWGLKQENEMLAQDNLKLKKILFNTEKQIPEYVADTLSQDVFNVYKCDIIKNSFSSYRNFLLLNKGASSGIAPDMGVFNSKGVIGVVERVSEKYAAVTSLLNSKTEINAIIKNSHHFGTLKWDGKDARYMQLIDVPSVANIKVGDEVVSGGMSAIFPENIPIGKVTKLDKEENSNYFVIRVTLNNDMTNLGHAYVIHNRHRKEIVELENQLEK